MIEVTLVGASVQEAIRSLAADHVCGREIRVVVLAMSKDDNPKALVLVFADGEDRPSLAIKVGLTATASAVVRSEAQFLSAVAQVDPGRVNGTVPRVVEVREVGLTAMLAMTAHPGTPLSVDYHRWGHTSRAECVAEDFRLAATWLNQVAALPVSPVLAANWAGKLRRRWAHHSGCAGASAVTQALEQRLLIERAPGLMHGDYWCGNVLRTEGRVSGVVDWEHALLGGDPLRDRVRFALAYSLYLDRHTRPGAQVRGHRGLVANRWGDGIRYVFGEQGWYSAQVQEFVGEGLEATGRSAEGWLDALLLGLSEIAVLSDQEDFARRHLELLAELTT